MATGRRMMPGVVKAMSEGKNGKQKLESERATERKAGMATGENGSGLKCELMAMEDIRSSGRDHDAATRVQHKQSGGDAV